GKDDGRVALYRRDRAALLASAGQGDGGERPDAEAHRQIREHLGRRGASFFRELRGAVGDAARNDDEALDALWDLVWSGEVTNDTFGSLRALSLPRSRSRASGARPRPGRLTSLGPPRAAGRWSLVAELVGEARSPTERGHATAVALLARYGVVTREAVMAANLPGGFSAVYPVLKAMEEAGPPRRGYFTAALRVLGELLQPIGPLRELVIERVDRDPVATSPLAEPLRAIGFRQAYRGWVLRAAGPSSGSAAIRT